MGDHSGPGGVWRGSLVRAWRPHKGDRGSGDGAAGWGVSGPAQPGSPYPLAGGAAVDALHATTMAGLALVDRGARRVALADTGVELAFATAGGLTAIR